MGNGQVKQTSAQAVLQGYYECEMQSSDVAAFTLVCVVVTGATSGIGKAYATEVTLQIPFCIFFLFQVLTC